LQITASAVDIDDLTQKDGATVAKLRRESTELVTGVGLRDRRSAFGNSVAREDRDAIG
jgi:hypothetical protein